MDKRNERFKKGEQVKVMNPYNHFFDEVAEVLVYDESDKRYLIKFDNGYKTFYHRHDLVRYLNPREQRDLTIEHLRQLADFALQIKDKEYFLKVTKRLKEMTGNEKRVTAN